MADLVNELRQGLGLDPLIYDDRIAAVARRWSERMSAEDRFEHNPNFGREMPPGWRTAAENISQVSFGGSLRDAVRRSFDGLADSPGHYDNMANPDLTHIGIGVALVNSRLWVTQNFGVGMR